MSETNQYIDVKTRIINAGYILTHMFRGLPYTPKNNTTLNQKLGHLHPAALNPNEYPRCQYYAIGDGGSRYTPGPTGKVRPRAVKHRSRDQSLFHLQPFVMRLATNDLPPELRKNYAMRTELPHEGLNYVAYWLKRIPITENETVEIINTIVQNGESTEIPFVSTSNDLSPTQPVLPPTGSIPTVEDADYLSVSLVIPDPWTDFDVNEYNNVCRILYGDDEPALIDEIMLVTGCDRVVNVNTPQGTITFNDVICAQGVQHLPTYDIMNLGEPDAGYTFELGVTEATLTEVL